MAWTQTHLDALDAAYARGIRRTTFVDGQSVEWHSIEEYLRLRREMLAAIGTTDGTRQPYRLVATSKGC